MRTSTKAKAYTLLLAACLLVAAGVWLGRGQPPALAAGKAAHRLVFQVTENDPDKMALVLNNVTNAAEAYAARGESFEIEVVTYGPGLHLVRDDTSPVKSRISALAGRLPGLAFSACENTRQGMKRREGKEIPLVSEAKSVPSGVVRVVELQEQGWTYIRP